MKSLRVGLVVLSAFLFASFVAMGAASKQPAGKVVDSGTFEIVVDGKRVGTETFTIHDQGVNNVTTSQIKIAAGTAKAEQSSVLEMTNAGGLVRYSWKETSPSKSQSNIEVTQNAVVQHILLPENKKPLDVPYMVSPSTMILDDNAFVHRQLLVWRYLRGSCGMKDGKQTCDTVKLGVLVPAQHVMAIISVEYVGNEKLAIKGVERDLAHIRIMSDDVEWDLWADPADAYKVVRIYIPSNKTEVLRN
ncbi:MAG: hypothetical protein HYX28_06535 [Candidatus Koribacter versatilis]|uniref:Uncharacterized protein n=1 Tax=Candidatus Korobacter versatilis TaxID=658062 RepID=A0A932EP44_9BACT|nr:hypothetical protein [Candidatus Koribacter versatilis]